MEHVQVIAFWLAFLFYAAAFVFFLYYLFSKREAQNRTGVIFAAVGWAFETAAVVLRAVQAGHVPIVGAYESLTTLTWVVVIVYLVLEWRTKIKAIGLYVMPAVCVLLAIAWTQFEAPVHLVPALKSDIVVIHVVVIFTAVAAFAVAGGSAVLYLFEERQLKHHRTGSVLGRLPSLRTLDRLTGHAIMFGLPFLSMGIVAGVIRAEKFKVADWWSDPLVLMAIATWIVYAVYVYTRLASGWRGRRAAYLAITGLVFLVLIRFVAVPYLSGFHTFGA